MITREEDLRGGGARLRLAVERVPHAARRHGEGPRRCRGQRAREPRDVGGGPVPHRRSGRLGDQDAEVSRRGHLTPRISWAPGAPWGRTRRSNSG